MSRNTWGGSRDASRCGNVCVAVQFISTDVHNQCANEILKNSISRAVVIAIVIASQPNRQAKTEPGHYSTGSYRSLPIFMHFSDSMGFRFDPAEAVKKVIKNPDADVKTMTKEPQG